MRHDVGYNHQRDNFDFSGKFQGWKQCFTTSSWMLMSFYSDKIDAEDDKGLSAYLDDVEASVGIAGIAEKVLQKFKFITGNTSLWWAVQREGIESWLWKNGVKGSAEFRDGGTWSELDTILASGPVILGTQKLGGLPGGHIILVIGKENGEYICHDPYGNANQNYGIVNGSSVEYGISMLQNHTGDVLRYMFWKSE